jgi:hypothetical protein
MFVFADSPPGGKDEKPTDVSAGQAFLLHQASIKEALDPATHGAGLGQTTTPV